MWPTEEEGEDYPWQSFKDGGKEQRWKKKKRNSCFITVVQRLQLSMKKKTGRFSLDKLVFFFHCFSLLTDLPSPLELMRYISQHFHKSSTFLDKTQI